MISVADVEMLTTYGSSPCDIYFWRGRVTDLWICVTECCVLVWKQPVCSWHLVAWLLCLLRGHVNHQWRRAGNDLLIVDKVKRPDPGHQQS